MDMQPTSLIKRVSVGYFSCILIKTISFVIQINCENTDYISITEAAKLINFTTELKGAVIIRNSLFNTVRAFSI